MAGFDRDEAETLFVKLRRSFQIVAFEGDMSEAGPGSTLLTGSV